MDSQGEKKCGRCKEILPLDRFSKKQSYCKSCIREYGRSSERKDYQKKYRDDPEIQELVKIYRKRYLLKRRWKTRRKKLEKILYYKSTVERECEVCKEIKPFTDFNKSNFYRDYGGRMLWCGSCNYDKNRSGQKKIRDHRWSNDKMYKTSNLIRNHMYRFLDGQKNKSTEEILGISTEGFTEYLESKFQQGMTWKNQGDWVLDHIVPISLGETEEELYKLNHYTNFQPLWKKENLLKSNHLFPEHYPLYETLLGKKFENNL